MKLKDHVLAYWDQEGAGVFTWSHTRSFSFKTLYVNLNTNTAEWRNLSGEYLEDAWYSINNDELVEMKKLWFKDVLAQVLKDED